MLKQMTKELRNKIKLYIKNRIDISDLIQDVNLAGEDLSNSIIKRCNIIKNDLTKTRFTKSTIGEEGKVSVICDNRAINSFWDDVQFNGHILFRKNDCKYSDFSGALMQNVEYQKTDFRYCRFCQTCIRIGTSYSAGSIFSEDLFKDLAKMWNLKIEVISETK